MYTGDVKTNVETYPFFVFMTESMARNIAINDLDVKDVYKKLDILEKTVSYSDMSEYVNINNAPGSTFQELRFINWVFRSEINPTAFILHNNINLDDEPGIFSILDKTNIDLFFRYVTYPDNQQLNDKTLQTKLTSDQDNETTTQSYELVKGNDGKSIIIIFKPSFKKKLKVRNELNDFILACLGELRSLLTDKDNLSRYKIFSKVTQL